MGDPSFSQSVVAVSRTALVMVATIHVVRLVAPFLPRRPTPSIRPWVGALLVVVGVVAIVVLHLA
jgi:uncharacterized membrane protein